MADTDVTVTFGAKVDELDSAIGKAKEKIESLKESTDKVSEGFKQMAEVFGIALSIEGIKEFVKSMAELGEAVERSSSMLGTSVANIVQLQGLAKVTGTSFDGLALSIERMSLNIQRSTRDAFNPQAQALHLLGLSAKELIGLPADQYFDRLREVVSKFNPSLNLTNALMEVGGRGVAQLIPILQKSGESYQHLKHDIEAANGALASQIPGMDETSTKLSLMSLSFQSFGGALFTVFKPAIDGVVTLLTRMAQSMRDSINESGILGTVLSGLAQLAKVLALALNGIVTGLQAIGIVASEVIQIMSFKASLSDLDAMKEKFVALGEQWRKTVDEMYGDTNRLHVNIGPKMDMGAINVQAKNQLDAAIRTIDGLIEQWKSYYEKVEIFDQSAVDTFKMTEGQKITHLLATNEEKKANIKGYYEQEIALAGGNAALVAELRNKMNKEIEDSDKKRMKMEAEQLKKSAQEWESALGSISSAFTGQLRGILTGTTTWAQAMKNIMLDLVLKITEEFLKLALVKPLAGMLSSALAPTEIFASLIKVISGMFGPLFAGFTSFFAPSMGPAAPAAGTAAAAGTVAAAISTVKLDTGTDYVPRTGLAMIHQGEAIIPASENIAPYSGGGQSVNISVSAWDAGSVQAWLRGGGGAMIAKHVATAMKSNPTLRPSY